MYLRDAVAGPLHGALLRNAWLDSGYMFCDSSGCVGCIAVIFYVMGYSDPEVFSVLLSWLGLRATLYGEVRKDEFSVAFRAVVTLGIWTVFLRALYFLQFCVRWSGVA